jgi:sulfur-carrier protein adenylyltransferase/sulfurtransferase
MDRFERQRILPEFGQIGQRALRNARVGVVGAGGLGCPALLYLAASGVGVLGIADGDVVEMSNLHRQILFGVKDIGSPKAEIAAKRLTEQYGDVDVKALSEYLNKKNLLEWVSSFDIIVDSTDQPTIRYMLADACYILDKPLVYGAIFRNQGQVSLFHCSEKRHSAHLRDAFPDAGTSIPNCNDAGVLGVLPGIIGTLQASEVIKYLSGYGTILLNTLLVYQLNTHHFYRIQIDSGEYCGPKDEASFMAWPYLSECDKNISSVSRLSDWIKNEISIEPNSLLVDIRQTHEVSYPQGSAILHIPLSELENRAGELSTYGLVGFLCSSGIRSREAVALMQRIHPENQYVALLAD